MRIRGPVGLLSGSDLASCLVASTPSMTGMRTSIRTTKRVDNQRQICTASVPSRWCRTTAKSGWVSSSAAEAGAHNAVIVGDHDPDGRRRTGHQDRGVETPAFRPGKTRRFTSPEMSVVVDSMFGISRYRLLPTPSPSAQSGAAGPLRPRPVRVEPGGRAASVLAPGPEERSGLPGAVPAAHPGAGGIPVAGRRVPDECQQQALRDFARARAAVLRPAQPGAAAVNFMAQG